MDKPTPDSRPDTWAHIHTVQELMADVIIELHMRALHHDASKLVSPELEIFDKYTPRLKESAYGSDEYRRNLEGMKPALDHHYAANTHHPDHWMPGDPWGENGMSLTDVIEMLADWKAASLRQVNGDLRQSIEINAERFGYGEQIKQLLLNTANHMGWIR